jgi:site-specific DNA recombinase
MKDPEKLVLGYVRVSTDGQEISVDAQDTRIRANAVSKGFRGIDEVIIDRESAKDLNREGLTRLLRTVTDGKVHAVIIWKLDRLTRSVKDLSYLLELFDKYNVALVSLNETLDTSTATGRMIVKITTLFSEWERETIGERTASALNHKRARGERMGNVPYGYSAGLNKRGPDGRTTEAAKLEDNKKEQAIIEKMKNMRKGGYSFREIAERLNTTGIMTRSGAPWRVQYVSSVLAQQKKREAV